MGFKLVLLAAGLSRRYGPENKLLAQWKGKHLYRWTLDRLETIYREQPEEYALLVVTQYQEIAEACARRNIPWVHNPKAAEGISTSLKLGLTQGGEGEQTAFFVADQPQLTEASIRGFLAGYARSGKGLGCVSWGEQLGNPCAFSAPYYPELLALKGDRGGKAVLRQHLGDCYCYPLSSGRELEDIDTKE